MLTVKNDSKFVFKHFILCYSIFITTFIEQFVNVNCKCNFFFALDAFAVNACIEFFLACSCNNNVYFYRDYNTLNKTLNTHLLYIFEGF